MKDELYTTLEMMQARVLDGLREIPEGRLHWKPTAASTSPAEIVWHMANTERRLAAVARGVDPNSINWIIAHHSYHAGQLFTLGALIRGGL